MLVLEDQQLAWFFKQSVGYGTAMAQQMTTTDLNTLMHWCYNNGLPLNKPAKTIETLGGSTTLIQWLLENNRATMKGLEESRQRWTADITGAQDGQQEDQQDIDENMYLTKMSQQGDADLRKTNSTGMRHLLRTPTEVNKQALCMYRVSKSNNLWQRDLQKTDHVEGPC